VNEKAQVLSYDFQTVGRHVSCSMLERITWQKDPKRREDDAIKARSRVYSTSVCNAHRCQCESHLTKIIDMEKINVVTHIVVLDVDELKRAQGIERGSLANLHVSTSVCPDICPKVQEPLSFEFGET